MPRLRPYVDADWEAVLGLCLVSFAPACESLGRLPQTESLARADPDWRTSIGRYLRSLTRSAERRRLLVAELRGSLVGVVHYEVDAEMQSGSIGVSAVHPAWQGKGIGTLMYHHVLDAMRAQGLKYATADTEDDASHTPARRVYEKLGFQAVPMVHYFKRLVTPEPADAGQERQVTGNGRNPARPARPANSSASRGGRKRR